MFTLMLRMAFVSVVALAAVAAPAMALCKYGGPHCVNRYPGQFTPPVNTTTSPDDGWVDPECQYYGNCYSTVARSSGGAVAPQPLTLLPKAK